MKQVIIVTGGIGCGKSTAMQRFKKESPSADFFNFDDYTTELYQTRQVQQFFINHFQTVDRKLISQLVFANPVLRKLVNDYFFPLVEQKLLDLINQYHRSPKTVYIECPMFSEMFYRSTRIIEQRPKLHVVVVTCDVQDQATRVMNRDKISYNAAMQRINSRVMQVVGDETINTSL